MNEEQLKLASKLWKDGMKVSVIARKVGAKIQAVQLATARKRHLFPIRQKAQSEARRSRSQKISPSVPREYPKVGNGQMNWITETGASVTLPKISMASCPRIGQ